MGLNVYSRYAYDDVAFIASTDADANAWRLEVGTSTEEHEWLFVDAVLMDSYLNWRTPDLTLWEPVGCQVKGTTSELVLP